VSIEFEVSRETIKFPAGGGMTEGQLGNRAIASGKIK